MAKFNVLAYIDELMDMGTSEEAAMKKQRKNTSVTKSKLRKSFGENKEETI